MSLDQIFATRSARMKASEIRELLKLLERPGVLSFAGGIPDAALFPTDEFANAYAWAMSEGQSASALQYSVSEGYLPLRKWLANHMTEIGVPCCARNILITSGSQQALDYLGKLFLSPGDTALVNWPTYMGALGAFNAYEPRYARLIANENRPASALHQEAAEAGGAVKFAYLSPDFANPTGETLSRDDRLALLDKANALGCAVIEDAAYQALRYDGRPIPPILALELERTGYLDACRTIYCGSFSKTLSPGLRVGWVVAASPVIEKLVLMKQAADLHSSTINQMAISYVAERVFDDHTAKIRKTYRARRDAMISGLARHMPDGVTWTQPEGGMFIWLTLPENMDADALLRDALEHHDIAFVPGRAFHADGSGANTLRLCFASQSQEDIHEGMRRLGAAMRMA